MINIITPDTWIDDVSSELLEQTARDTLHHMNVENNAELSIVIDGNVKLRQLNQQFRGIDAPTDVLSFPAEMIDLDTGAAYLGDIIISWEKVVAQAKIQPVECELRLMVIHGILHLLGYDHDTNQRKQEMWQIQQEILKKYGCKSPPATQNSD